MALVLADSEYPTDNFPAMFDLVAIVVSKDSSASTSVNFVMRRSVYLLQLNIDDIKAYVDNLTFHRDDTLPSRANTF